MKRLTILMLSVFVCGCLSAQQPDYPEPPAPPAPQMHHARPEGPDCPPPPPAHAPGEKTMKMERKPLTEHIIEFVQSQNILTEEEMNTYATLLRQQESEKKALRTQNIQLRKQARTEEMSEEAYRTLLTTQAANQLKMTEIDQTYLQKMLEKIPAEKMYKIQQARNEFKREMLEQGPNHCPHQSGRKCPHQTDKDLNDVK